MLKRKIMPDVHIDERFDQVIERTVITKYPWLVTKRGEMYNVWHVEALAEENGLPRQIVGGFMYEGDANVFARAMMLDKV